MVPGPTPSVPDSPEFCEAKTRPGQVRGPGSCERGTHDAAESRSGPAGRGNGAAGDNGTLAIAGGAVASGPRTGAAAGRLIRPSELQGLGGVVSARTNRPHSPRWRESSMCFLAARSVAVCKRTWLSLPWPSGHRVPTALLLPGERTYRSGDLRRPRSQMTKRKRGSVYQRLQAPPKASARAAAQAPYRSMTVDGAGHSPAWSRLSASPPRRRACVRDQSQEDGAAP